MDIKFFSLYFCQKFRRKKIKILNFLNQTELNWTVTRLIIKHVYSHYGWLNRMEKVTNTAEIVVVVVEFINSQKLGGKKINSFNSSLLSLWYGMMNEKKIVVCYTHTHTSRVLFFNFVIMSALLFAELSSSLEMTINELDFSFLLMIIFIII